MKKAKKQKKIKIPKLGKIVNTKWRQVKASIEPAACDCAGVIYPPRLLIQLERDEIALKEADVLRLLKAGDTFIAYLYAWKEAKEDEMLRAEAAVEREESSHG